MLPSYCGSSVTRQGAPSSQHRSAGTKSSTGTWEWRGFEHLSGKEQPLK